MYTSIFRRDARVLGDAEDGTAIGVQFNTGSISGRDFEQARTAATERAAVPKRSAQQAADSAGGTDPNPAYKSAKSTINGHDVSRLSSEQATSALG